MKNLYAAFFCILGMLTALTQSQAKDLSGSPDSAYLTSIARDYLPAHSPNVTLTNKANYPDTGNFQLSRIPDTIANAVNTAGTSTVSAPIAFDSLTKAR